MLNVVCVKSISEDDQTLYTHQHVNRLYKAVKKNLTAPHRFVCFTDDPSGVKCKTKTFPAGLKGWWPKLYLFKEGLFDGPVLYFDLDTLILGNLDFLSGYDGSLAILRDFYRDDGYGSGVMMWNPKVNGHVWDLWVKQGFPKHPLGDQGWMENFEAEILQDLYPDRFISFKVHCPDSYPPREARVLCFHGYPKPEDFADGHWVTRKWLEG